MGVAVAGAAASMVAPNKRFFCCFFSWSWCCFDCYNINSIQILRVERINKVEGSCLWVNLGLHTPGAHLVNHLLPFTGWCQSLTLPDCHLVLSPGRISFCIFTELFLVHRVNSSLFHFSLFGQVWLFGCCLQLIPVLS